MYLDGFGIVAVVFIGIGYTTTVLFQSLQEGKHYIWSFLNLLLSWALTGIFLSQGILDTPNKTWEIWWLLVLAFGLYLFGIPVIIKCIAYWCRR